MTRHQVNRPRRLAIVAALLVGFIVVAGGGGWLLFADRGTQLDVTTDQRDAAKGAAEQVIDCVQDPDTDATKDCEAEAQQAQETLEEAVPAATLSKGQRADVVLIASQLLAARPTPSQDDVVDEVLARLPDVDDGQAGEQGPRGRPGVDGESPTTAEVRALVQAVYDANPPRPGADGTNGATGAVGSQGPKGEKGDRGDTGAVGPQGQQGPQGPQGATGDTGAQGPIGPAGTPGPVCPAGYEGRVLDVLTPADGPLQQPVVVSIFACIPVAPDSE